MQAAESMDLAGKSLWQVGAGDTERSYGEYCRQFDVMIAGPGDPGPYEDSIYADVVNRSSLRRFCNIRYALHGRLGDEFKLEAYLKILNLRDSYPVLGCAGAVEAVLGMAR